MTGTYTVERRRVIPVDRADLRELIIDFSAWERWSPWEDLDPAQERAYSGAASGAGAVYAWSGNRKAGAGRMEITAVTEDRVDIAPQPLLMGALGPLVNLEKLVGRDNELGLNRLAQAAGAA